MLKYLLLTLGLLAFSGPGANATLIATFGQTELGDTVTATDNGTVTNIDVVDSTAGVTSFVAGPIGNVFFDLHATSNDAAVLAGPAIIQHFDGNFCFTSLASCGGINYLSGTFTDAAFGANGGPGLVVNVSSPPDLLSLTSDIIPASELLAPAAFNLGFSNLSPLLFIDGATLGAFNATYAGNVSANGIPEPFSIGLLGMGLFGLGMVRNRKQ